MPPFHFLGCVWSAKVLEPIPIHEFLSYLEVAMQDWTLSCKSTWSTTNMHHEVNDDVTSDAGSNTSLSVTIQQCHYRF